MFDRSELLRNMLGQGLGLQQQQNQIPNPSLNFNLMPQNPLAHTPISGMTNPGQGMGMPNAMPQNMGMSGGMNPHSLGAASMYAAQTPGSQMSIPNSGVQPNGQAANGAGQGQNNMGDSLRKMMMMQYLMGGDPQQPQAMSPGLTGISTGSGGAQTSPAGLLNSFPGQLPQMQMRRYLGQG